MTWEERWHPLRNEWVVVAAHRNDRPWNTETVAVAATTTPQYVDDCYLCPGNSRQSLEHFRPVFGDRGRLINAIEQVFIEYHMQYSPMASIAGRGAGVNAQTVASDENDALLLVGIGAGDEGAGHLAGGVEGLMRHAGGDGDEIALVHDVEKFEVRAVVEGG